MSNNTITIHRSEENNKTNTNFKNNKLTWQEVMDTYKQGETFTAWVDCNPCGMGTRTKLKFVRKLDYIDSYFAGQGDIYGIDYTWFASWELYYTGTFEIVEEPLKEETIMQSNNKLTWQEVMDKYQEGDRFVAWVDSNPYGRGTRTKLKFGRIGDYIDSYEEGQENINGVDYAWLQAWESHYTGTFEIVEEKTNN